MLPDPPSTPRREASARRPASGSPRNVGVATSTARVNERLAERLGSQCGAGGTLGDVLMGRDGSAPGDVPPSPLARSSFLRPRTAPEATAPPKARAGAAASAKRERRVTVSAPAPVPAPPHTARPAPPSRRPTTVVGGPMPAGFPRRSFVARAVARLEAQVSVTADATRGRTRPAAKAKPEELEEPSPSQKPLPPPPEARSRAFSATARVLPPATQRVMAKVAEYRDDPRKRQALEERVAAWGPRVRAKRTLFEERPPELPDTMPDVIELHEMTHDPAVEQWRGCGLSQEKASRWMADFRRREQRRLQPAPPKTREAMRPVQERRDRDIAAHRLAAARAFEQRLEERRANLSDVRHAACAAARAAAEEAARREAAARDFLVAAALGARMSVMLRQHFLTDLVTRARSAVEVLRRYLRRWMAPAVEAQHARRTARARQNWRKACCAAWVIGHYRFLHRAADSIKALVRGVRVVGRVSIAIQAFYRNIRLCQRAVRAFLTARVARLQLLHLQWLKYESAAHCTPGLGVVHGSSVSRRGSTAHHGHGHRRASHLPSPHHGSDEGPEGRPLIDLPEHHHGGHRHHGEQHAEVDIRAHLPPLPFATRHFFLVRLLTLERRRFVQREVQREADVEMPPPRVPSATRLARGFTAAHDAVSPQRASSAASTPPLPSTRRLRSWLPYVVTPERMEALVGHCLDIVVGRCMESCGELYSVGLPKEQHATMRDLALRRVVARPVASTAALYAGVADPPELDPVEEDDRAFGAKMRARTGGPMMVPSDAALLGRRREAVAMALSMSGRL